MNKSELRDLVRTNMQGAVDNVNAVLSGAKVDEVEDILIRVARGGKEPHWLAQLKDDGTLPNSDGKTIGSIVEMIFLAVLEKWTLEHCGVGPMSISPARGVDFPDLDLGLKSPSSNYCTSEPFFSPYERLVGSHYDAVILLSDYQEKKKAERLRLQITDFEYLFKTQIADASLCEIGRTQRDFLLEKNDAWARRMFRFLAYVNGSDWRCKAIRGVFEVLSEKTPVIDKEIDRFGEHFLKANLKLVDKGEEPIPQEELDAIVSIKDVSPRLVGILDAADNWVVQTHKEFARMPNDSEWALLRDGPLDGAIGMSYALQWRYNFGKLFNKSRNSAGIEGNSD